MLNTRLLEELLLAAIGAAVIVMLRASGGPHRLPSCNSEFVWY